MNAAERFAAALEAAERNTREPEPITEPDTHQVPYSAALSRVNNIHIPSTPAARFADQLHRIL